jgi:squalene-associated FAD-dependent desaturase
MTGPEKINKTVLVVGGGLAGLAAGCALSDAGFKVIILERRPYLGGRASSYQHPGTGEVVDNCQHVLLGCCTNLIDFYHRINVGHKIRWFDKLVFLEPGGRESVIQGSFLPAPFHSSPSFLKANCLRMSDKVAIARALMMIARRLPENGTEHFLGWLRRNGQTPQAIERFWKVVLVSALNEDLDRVSSHYGAQVFRESFLKSAQAGHMGVPTVPLTELYSAAGDYIQQRGGEVHLRTGVESFSVEHNSVAVTAGDRKLEADYVVLAVPFNGIASILPEEPRGEPLRQAAAALQCSPITGIHLWFDRQITDLEHAVLLDRTIQWMFHKSKLLQTGGRDGSYIEVVVSASKGLMQKSRTEIVELAVLELCDFFPVVRTSRLVKSAVIKEVHATYSPVPGVDEFRPPPTTSWDSVFLAGDWTATDWPATMEGAVRSGYLAAEALARTAGLRRPKFLVADLPPTGLMRWFG